MEYLKKEDIILINRMTIGRHGGNFVPPFNFLNQDTIDYLVEAVEGELFGVQIYPKLSDKTRLYMYNIVSGHAFQDGNKRTGLGAALLFLKLNGCQLKESLTSIEFEGKQIPRKGKTSSEILFHFTTEMASGEIILKEAQMWFEKNIKTI